MWFIIDHIYYSSDEWYNTKHNASNTSLVLEDERTMSGLEDDTSTHFTTVGYTVFESINTHGDSCTGFQKEY